MDIQEQTKTDTASKIPLLPMAQEIIDKYADIQFA
jgi:hypothetical protein